LIVNDRLDVALAVGADGVQRTSTSLDVEDIRRVAGPALRVGASVHSALDAEAKRADFLVFGPIYETPSKRPYGPPQGLDRLAKLAAGVRRPVVAIGGGTPPRRGETDLAGRAAV